MKVLCFVTISVLALAFSFPHIQNAFNENTGVSETVKLSDKAVQNRDVNGFASRFGGMAQLGNVSRFGGMGSKWGTMGQLGNVSRFGQASKFGSMAQLGNVSRWGTASRFGTM